MVVVKARTATSVTGSAVALVVIAIFALNSSPAAPEELLGDVHDGDRLPSSVAVARFYAVRYDPATDVSTVVLECHHHACPVAIQVVGRARGSDLLLSGPSTAVISELEDPMRTDGENVTLVLEGAFTARPLAVHMAWVSALLGLCAMAPFWALRRPWQHAVVGFVVVAVSAGIGATTPPLWRIVPVLAWILIAPLLLFSLGFALRWPASRAIVPVLGLAGFIVGTWVFFDMYDIRPTH